MSKTNTKFNDAKSILDIHEKHHIAFTDGSCQPNNKSAKSRGGYASSFISGKYTDECIYGNLEIDKIHASNIRAEGMAIIKVFAKVYNDPDDWDALTIVTDCELWVNMLNTWMPKWSKKKFKEMSNTDMTLLMWKYYNKLIKKGHVYIIHMKSHDKEGWSKYPNGTYQKFCYVQNDYVDSLACYARTTLEPGNLVNSLSEYE
jgi:ribonuclease HI